MAFDLSQMPGGRCPPPSPHCHQFASRQGKMLVLSQAHQGNPETEHLCLPGLPGQGSHSSQRGKTHPTRSQGTHSTGRGSGHTEPPVQPLAVGEPSCSSPSRRSNTLLQPRTTLQTDLTQQLTTRDTPSMTDTRNNSSESQQFITTTFTPVEITF